MRWLRCRLALCRMRHGLPQMFPHRLADACQVQPLRNTVDSKSQLPSKLDSRMNPTRIVVTLWVKVIGSHRMDEFRGQAAQSVEVHGDVAGELNVALRDINIDQRVVKKERLTAEE